MITMKPLLIGGGLAAAMLAGLWAYQAKAADLGGNCCADLEERVAELEAVTIRKGNRKVRLTVSGYVSHAVMFWDDGNERNLYIGDETAPSQADRFQPILNAIDHDGSAEAGVSRKGERHGEVQSRADGPGGRAKGSF